MYIAKPTKQQLLWHELELGVFGGFSVEHVEPVLIEAGNVLALLHRVRLVEFDLFGGFGF